MRKSILEQQIGNYMCEDKTNYMDLHKKYLMYLNSNRIRPIIVSGAPRDILDKYRINIYKIYGLVAEEENDRFSAKELHNY